MELHRAFIQNCGLVDDYRRWKFMGFDCRTRNFTFRSQVRGNNDELTFGLPPEEPSGDYSVDYSLDYSLDFLQYSLNCSERVNPDKNLSGLKELPFFRREGMSIFLKSKTLDYSQFGKIMKDSKYVVQGGSQKFDRVVRLLTKLQQNNFVDMYGYNKDDFGGINLRQRLEFIALGFSLHFGGNDLMEVVDDLGRTMEEEMRHKPSRKLRTTDLKCIRIIKKWLDDGPVWKFTLKLQQLISLRHLQLWAISYKTPSNFDRSNFRPLEFQPGADNVEFQSRFADNNGGLVVEFTDKVGKKVTFNVPSGRPVINRDKVDKAIVMALSHVQLDGATVVTPSNNQPTTWALYITKQGIATILQRPSMKSEDFNKLGKAGNFVSETLNKVSDCQYTNVRNVLRKMGGNLKRTFESTKADFNPYFEGKTGGVMPCEAIREIFCSALELNRMEHLVPIIEVLSMTNLSLFSHCLHAKLGYLAVVAQLIYDAHPSDNGDDRHDGDDDNSTSDSDGDGDKGKFDDSRAPPPPPARRTRNCGNGGSDDDTSNTDGGKDNVPYRVGTTFEKEFDEIGYMTGVVIGCREEVLDGRTRHIFQVVYPEDGDTEEIEVSDLQKYNPQAYAGKIEVEYDQIVQDPNYVCREDEFYFCAILTGDVIYKVKLLEFMQEDAQYRHRRVRVHWVGWGKRRRSEVFLSQLIATSNDPNASAGNDNVGDSGDANSTMSKGSTPDNLIPAETTDAKSANPAETTDAKSTTAIDDDKEQVTLKSSGTTETSENMQLQLTIPLEGALQGVDASILRRVAMNLLKRAVITLQANVRGFLARRNKLQQQQQQQLNPQGEVATGMEEEPVEGGQEEAFGGQHQVEPTGGADSVVQPTWEELSCDEKASLTHIKCDLGIRDKHAAQEKTTIPLSDELWNSVPEDSDAEDSDADDDDTK